MPGETQLLFPDFLDGLGTLADDDDVVEWINGLLDEKDEQGSGNPDLNSLDRYVSRLIPSLDVASEDVSSNLERLIDEISRSTSRLSYDLHFMRDGATSLQDALSDLAERSNSSVSRGTSDALDRLHSLDIIKSHMITARDVLREAESWSTLESEVLSLLTEQNYEKAAEKLSEANKSMVVFENTSDYDHRRTLMISLQNQLEASLSSALIAAINSQNVAVCRNYYAIFCNIQRDLEFRTYYYGSRRSSLVTTWQDARYEGSNPPPPPSSPEQSFSAFLSAFFSAFISILNAERTSVSAIFPDPQATMASFVTSTLAALQPTFSERLASMSIHHGASALLELIEAFKATEQFAIASEKILQRAEYTGPPIRTISGDAKDIGMAHKSHSRWRSTRLSISQRMNPTTSSAGESKNSIASTTAPDWDQEVLEPFLEFQVDYGGLEGRFLSAALQNIMHTDDTRTDASVDHARLLKERSVDVFSLAEESLGRVLSFTHGFGAVGLLQALENLFRKFIDSSKSQFSEQSFVSQRSFSTSNSSDDLADLDYTSEDWAHIQMWLHLLGALRVVLDRMTVFESKLYSVLLQVSTTIRSLSHDLASAYIPGTTKGEVHLLTQSVLNSAKLHALLQEVDPESQIYDPSGPKRSHSIRQRVSLLPNALASLTEFSTFCQTSLQHAMLSPLRKHLSNYSASPLWTAPSDPRTKRSGATATSDAQVPVFSLSPTETIQRVAEGLLNLPRLFEVYADDDVLSFSIDTLPFVDRDLIAALSEQAAGDARLTHPRRQSMSLKNQALPPKPAPEFSPEAIASIWLSSLGLSLLSHLTTAILPRIPSLTSAGAAQLSSDLEYLTNIVSSLNVASEELETWREYIRLGDEDGPQRGADVGSNNAIFAQVARMRDWSVA